MYGISSEENFDFLIGIRLQQVCFGENELVLHFDNAAISCTIEADVEIVTPARGRRVAEDARSLAHDLLDLLGKTIKGINPTQRTLALVFDDEFTLVLHDSEESYESFNIKYGDRIIVV